VCVNVQYSSHTVTCCHVVTVSPALPEKSHCH